MFCYEVVSEDVLHITSKELSVGDAIYLRVYLCILNSLRNILYAYNLRSTLSNKICYRTSACIKVID